MKKRYFRIAENAPDPLRMVVSRAVRFEEVDPLAVVWHGRYPGYFEDARVALGDALGIGYLDFHRAGVYTPIKSIQVDYHQPLRYPQNFTIEAILHYSEAARINMEFVIRNEVGEVTTTGATVQMFVSTDNDLLMLQPEFYSAFCRQWQTGTLPPLAEQQKQS